MNEVTLTERQKRIMFKANLPNYLHDLGILLQRVVKVDDLVGLNESEKISEYIRSISTVYKTEKYQITFIDYKKIDFNALIEELHKHTFPPVFVWSTYTNECGFLKLDKGFIEIKNLNDFLFQSNICVFISNDLSQRLLIDFTNNNGDQDIIFEVYGEKWSKVFSNFNELMKI